MIKGYYGGKCGPRCLQIAYKHMNARATLEFELHNFKSLKKIFSPINMYYFHEHFNNLPFFHEF